MAHGLGWPCATGIKHLEMTEADGRRTARREYRGGEETFEFGLPAVITVKEGINLPRYPSLPGRLRAKRAAIERDEPQWQPEGLRKRRCGCPASRGSRPRCWAPGRMRCPPWSGCWTSWGS